MSSIDSFHTQKVRLLITVLILFSLGIVVLLIKWQVFDNERFIAIANERYREQTIPSVRGSVLASDGSTLAYSEPRFDAYVWLPELQLDEKDGNQTRREFLEKVSAVLQTDPGTLDKTLNNGQLWIKIASQLTQVQKDQLLNLPLDSNPKVYLQGIQFQYVNIRVYPEKSLASHVIGFVGSSFDGTPKGVGGIEQYWDGSLKPQEGYDSGEFDSLGNLITLTDSQPLEPKPGVTIYTTIDKTLQAKLEAQLKDGLDAFKADSVTGIIMDPKTGAILAMANAPDFDPNQYYKQTDPAVFGNEAITDPYEIGSVAKVFTLSAALDLGTVTPQTVLLPHGHNGCEIITPNPKPTDKCFVKADNIQCICTADSKPNHTSLTAALAFINSDNIGFRHIAMTMTYQQFHDYLVKFGVGSTTGIELAGESTAILKDAADWNFADQAVFSYGQSYEMTPIQAITGVASVDNGGQRMQPYLVSKVIDADGKETDFTPRNVEDPISATTAQTMGTIMHQNYLNSLIEKKYKFLSAYAIGLKSGTALIPYRDKAGYSADIDATYVGFDESPDKKFIMLIKVHRPKIGDLSYLNARVIWLDTFEAIKDYLGVKPYNGS